MKISTKEVANMIYDKLFDNWNDQPKFDLDNIQDDVSIDNTTNQIRFDYCGEKFSFIVKKII